MHRVLVILLSFWGAAAWASPPESVDRIEAVQRRAWARAGGFTAAPFLATGLDDPFLLRGGLGARATFWPRSLVGVTLEASAWGQSRTQAAIVAQRELRARMRPTGSGWLASAGLEIVGVDGKLAAFGAILPLELALRTGVGAASSRDEFSSAPTLAFTGALILRWLAGRSVGIETALALRTATLERVIDGRRVASSDTVVSFELAVPFLLGARR